LNIFAKQGSVDRYLARNISDVRQVLKRQSGEFHLRVHSQPEYAVARENLFHEAKNADKSFWHGKVSLRSRVVSKSGDITDTVFLILFRGTPIGEIRESDVPIGEINETSLRAKDLLDFSPEAKYFGRAVIQDDLMGFTVRLFINPINFG